MTDIDRLRLQQHKLREQIGFLRAVLHERECELIRVDRQLGEFNNLNQPGSGRDTTGVP